MQSYILQFSTYKNIYLTNLHMNYRTHCYISNDGSMSFMQSLLLIDTISAVMLVRYLYLEYREYSR